MGLTATPEIINLLTLDWNRAREELPAFLEAQISNQSEIAKVLCALLVYQDSLSSYESYRKQCRASASAQDLPTETKPTDIQALVDATILIRVVPPTQFFGPEKPVEYQFKGETIFTLATKSTPLTQANISNLKSEQLAQAHNLLIQYERHRAEVQQVVIASFKCVQDLRKRNQTYETWAASFDPRSLLNLNDKLREMSAEDVPHITFYSRLLALIKRKQWSNAAAVIRLMTPHWAYFDFTSGQTEFIADLMKLAPEIKSKSAEEQAAYVDYVHAVIDKLDEFTLVCYQHMNRDVQNLIHKNVRINTFWHIDILHRSFPELARRFYLMDPLGYDQSYREKSSLPAYIKEYIGIKKDVSSASCLRESEYFIKKYSLRTFLKLDPNLTRIIYNKLNSKKDLYSSLFNVDQALLGFLVMGDTQEPTVESVQQRLRNYHHDFAMNWGRELERDGYEPLRWLFKAGEHEHLSTILAQLYQKNKIRFVRELEPEIKTYLTVSSHKKLNIQLMKALALLGGEEALPFLTQVPQPFRKFSLFHENQPSSVEEELPSISLAQQAGFDLKENEKAFTARIEALHVYLKKGTLDTITDLIVRYPALEEIIKSVYRKILENDFTNPKNHWFALNLITDNELAEVFKDSRRNHREYLEKLIIRYKQEASTLSAGNNTIVLGILTRFIHAMPNPTALSFEKAEYRFTVLFSALPENLACTLITKCSDQSIKEGFSKLSCPQTKDQGEVEEFLENMLKMPRAFEQLLLRYKTLPSSDIKSLFASNITRLAISYVEGCEAFLSEKGFLVKPESSSAPPLESEGDAQNLAPPPFDAPPAPAVEDFAPPPFEAPSAYALPPEVQAEISALKARIKDLEEELSDKTDELDALKRDKGIPKEKGRYGSQTHRADAATEIDADIWENFVADQVGGAVKQLLSFHRKSVSDDRKTSPVAESSGIKFK